MRAEMSIPVIDPVEPTARARQNKAAPLPQPMSSPRSPGCGCERVDEPRSDRLEEVDPNRVVGVSDLVEDLRNRLVSHDDRTIFDSPTQRLARRTFGGSGSPPIPGGRRVSALVRRCVVHGGDGPPCPGRRGGERVEPLFAARTWWTGHSLRLVDERVRRTTELVGAGLRAERIRDPGVDDRIDAGRRIEARPAHGIARLARECGCANRPRADGLSDKRRVETELVGDEPRQEEALAHEVTTRVGEGAAEVSVGEELADAASRTRPGCRRGTHQPHREAGSVCPRHGRRQRASPSRVPRTRRVRSPHVSTSG